MSVFQQDFTFSDMNLEGLQFRLPQKRFENDERPPVLGETCILASGFPLAKKFWMWNCNTQPSVVLTHDFPRVLGPIWQRQSMYTDFQNGSLFARELQIWSEEIHLTGSYDIFSNSFFLSIVFSFWNNGAYQHQSSTYSPITNLGVQVHLHLQSITPPSQYRMGATILDSSCPKSRKSELLAGWRAAFGVTFSVQLCCIGRGWVEG